MADQQQAQGAWGQPQGQQQQGGRGRGRGGYNNNNNNNQQQQNQQPQLPPGWQLAFAPTGEPYYVDHNTRTTHWQLPAQYQQLNQNQSSFGGRGGARGGRGGRVGIDGQKRKTKMCMNFENGSCAWGDKCAFAHGAQELVATNNQGNNNNAPAGQSQKPAGAQ